MIFRFVLFPSPHRLCSPIIYATEAGTLKITREGLPLCRVFYWCTVYLERERARKATTLRSSLIRTRDPLST